MTTGIIKYWTLLALLFLTVKGWGQMEVSDATVPPLTPVSLIENIFLGDGVTVMDVTYEGTNAAVGFFKNADPILGVDRGIVMTTGRASNANPATGPFGPDGVGSDFADTDNPELVGDPDIAAVVGNPGDVNDLAKFTITFQPSGDTLRFKYIWGSEEYPEFTCSDFNDVFGFFISGPGIMGPYENNGRNIAMIPGTSLPVTINNVNSGNVGANGTPANCTPPNGSLAFSQFYNDNNALASQPVYDGYTTPLTAEVIVQPCETYTIKLMIADVGDGNFDSGVFLEAKSFGTGSLDVQATTVSLDESLAEGCADGHITFELPNPAPFDFPVDFNLIGTATLGADYTLSTNTATILQGDTTITIFVTPLEDGITEPLESIMFDVSINPCKRDTFTIFIKDRDLVIPDLFTDTTTCSGDIVFLNGTSPTIIPQPMSFSNSTGQLIDPINLSIISEIDVSNVFPRNLGPGVIESICFNIEHSWADDLDIFLSTPSGQFIELTTDNGADGDNYTGTCFTPTATTIISDPGPVAPASSAPFTGDWLPEGPWSDIYGGPTNGTWQLLMSDDAMGFSGNFIDWSINFANIYEIEYNWSPNIDITCTDCPATDVFPTDTTTYVLTVSDTYGCVLQDSTQVNPVLSLPAPVITCGTITENSIEFLWNDIAGSTGYEINIGGAGWISPNSGNLAHIVNGLNLRDTIEIEVRGIFPCGAEIGIAECFTPICSPPSLSLLNMTPVTCFGQNDGQIEVQATGGLGAFVYFIDGIPNGPDNVFTGLSAGMYEILVNDAVACPQTIMVEVTQPEALAITPIVLENVDCFGNSTGTATITATGGIHPYIFNWDGSIPDSIAMGLAAGMHTIQLTDNNGCISNSTVQITQPDALAFASDSSSVICNGENNGTATVVALGGSGPYNYLWDANANGQIMSTATGLFAGNYQVTVTDDSLCQIVASVMVNEPLILSTGITGLDPNCHDGIDGSATAIPTGGTMPYRFRWNDAMNSSTATASGLSGLNYEVTITDDNGCTTLADIDLNNPDEFFVSTMQTDVDCFGAATGTATASVMGLIGTPTFEWDTGDATATISNVTAGNYCVSVTNTNGCEEISCLDIIQPQPFNIDPTIISAGCNGESNGAITLSVSGGTANYNFNWFNNEMDDMVENLPAGDYSVTVSDANFCDTIVMLSVTESTPFVLTVSEADISCPGENDGSIGIQTSGASDILDYVWTGPGGFSSVDSDLDSLEAGIYELVATDLDGCSVIGIAEIMEPDAVLIDYSINDVQCFGQANGLVIINLENGSAPFVYSIDSGMVFQNQSIFNGLAAGDYNILIQDANGCEVADVISIDQPNELIIDMESVLEIFFSDSIQLIANLNFSTGIIQTLEWSPLDATLSCTDCLDPFVKPPFSTDYTLHIVDSTNCEVTAMTRVVVDRTPSVYVPTAFSPNGDGQNDILSIYTDERITEEIESFSIYNRWGAQVYKVENTMPNDQTIGWDGTLNGEILNPAVFVWMAEVRLIDGEVRIYSGDFTLIK